MAKQQTNGKQFNLSNNFPRSLVIAPGTTGNASGSTVIASGSYTFQAGWNYLIIVNAQQTTVSTSGSVWQFSAQVNGTDVGGGIRLENGTGNLGQRGTTHVASYSAASTGALTVGVYLNRLTGTASCVWELPIITIVPTL